MPARDGVVLFPTGTRARVASAGPETAGPELVARLGLPVARATVVVNGATGEPRADLADGLADAIGGVADLAVAHDLTVLTGGTDAGIFSVLGAAMAGRSAPLVGVVPAGAVTWPGEVGAGPGLEPHHSHFVAVTGDRWGDETPTLLALAAALGARAPSAAVVVGGGACTRDEARGHLRAGRPVLVVAGSGGVADELAAAMAAPGGRPDARSSSSAPLVACPIEGGRPAVRAALAALLGLADGGP
ncbi:MAG: hypothetical protein ABR511_00675 [Acidimicrobiales bacterium]